MEVFLQHSSRAVTQLKVGLVTRLRVPNNPTVVIVEVTRLYCCERCGWGMEILASVRAVQHWVSRWRRGLRVLRKQNASMVLAHKLPAVPEVVQHVHSFL